MIVLKCSFDCETTPYKAQLKQIYRKNIWIILGSLNTQLNIFKLANR